MLLKQQPEPALNSTSLQKRMCQKSSSIIRCPESGKSSERTSTPYLVQETRPYKVFRLHTKKLDNDRCHVRCITTSLYSFRCREKLVDEPDTYNGEEITDEVIAMLARNSREVPFAMPMNNVMPMASTTGNRPAGVASFAVNFEPGGQAPLDARRLVPNKTDLIAAATYSGKNTYNGMLVVVGDNGDGKPALYVLKDMTKITQADYGGWIRLDVGAQTLIQIINDLTTGGTNKALSAEQGKVLKGLVDTLTNKVNALGAVYVPKGTLADLSALKGVSSVSKGHVYNVTAEVTLNGKKYPAETNFVYIGETANQASVETNWDSLGGTVDLTAYAKKA